VKLRRRLWLQRWLTCNHVVRVSLGPGSTYTMLCERRRFHGGECRGSVRMMGWR